MSVNRIEGAKVEETYVPGGYAGDTKYAITGPLDAVERAVDGLMAAYPPAGYSTRFGKPSEIGVVTWFVTGERSNSCD